ncbi:MAG: DUF302 domain-containing protein [Steroidobacteraceae bacterium]|jgi:uncharacterized protein (DUF302 family)|nr:DUF302 domain-containing protein [Steroidobacteraceae bacterium]
MSYYIAKRTALPLDAAVSRVTEALRAEGFGVLTDIDVRATLKAKLGAEFPGYRILGACNPKIAHEALQLEDKLGVLLPCNVIVREAGGGECEIAAIDPVTSLERTGNAALVRYAEEVRARLERAVHAVTP